MAGELARIQEMLRGEVLNLRELMQQMKPQDLSPRQLLDFLAEYVDRFWRETGISASFVSDLDEVSLPPAVCREVARIVQEALVNVRKHSGAQNVIVRLGREPKAWKLEVDDDGRGFDFEGRLSQEELDDSRKGPVIIKERVRAIGGQLTVESSRGRGARLEISLPRTRG
jgi:signal transduction histidine kinase